MAGDAGQCTVRVETLDGGWETLGADRLRGIVPEGIVCTSNRWGPDSCSFTLGRDPAAAGADLSTWTPVEIEVAGVVVWDGRIKATPTADSVNVQGQGWQYHLDDDVYDRVYVHTRLGDYRDVRTFPTANRGSFREVGQVTAGSGAIALAWPANTPSIGWAGAILDLGPGNTAKRVVIEWDSSNNDAGTTFFARGCDTPDPTAGGTVDAFSFTLGSGAIGTTAGTFSTAKRYVALFIFRNTSITPAADIWIRLKSVKTFSDTAYESSNASVLTLDQVAVDALSRATQLLSSDRSEIQPGTFPIAEFAVTDQTPRQALTAANAYENYAIKMLPGRRLSVRTRPSVPVFEIGEWSGADFQDASAGSGDDIVNRFVVRGTGPDGAQIRVDRRSSDIGATTLADRRGFNHTRTMSAGAAITTAVGERIGDLYLRAHSTAPFAGSFRAVPGGVRHAGSATEPHPAWLLLATGELVRCMHRIDPDTGGFGRAGEIDTVTYTADALASDVALNENRAGLEALLARYQVVVGQRA